jgi:hypothetical protein
MSRTVGLRVSSEAHLGWGDPKAVGDLAHGGLFGCLRHPGKRRPQREERHERDAGVAAELQQRLGVTLEQVHLVLDAGDLRVGEPGAHLLEGDVAEADAADLALFSQLDHGRELLLERTCRAALAVLVAE